MRRIARHAKENNAAAVTRRQLHRESLELEIAIHLVRSPAAAAAVNSRWFAGPAKAVVELAEDYPALCGQIGILGVAKATRQHAEIVDFIQWLYIAPTRVRDSLLPVAELSAELAAAAKIKARPRAWERHLTLAVGAGG